MKETWGNHVLKVGDSYKYKEGNDSDTAFTVPSDAVSEEYKKFIKTYRQEIEPWLTAVFQSEHLSLLVGNGLNKAVVGIAGGKQVEMKTDYSSFGKYEKKIKDFADELAKKMKRGQEANIEDQIRVANELLQGLKILQEDYKEDYKMVKNACDNLLKNLITAILESEYSIRCALESQDSDLSRVRFFIIN